MVFESTNPSLVDILMGVTTMESFCVAPHQGHLDRLKCIYGYLKLQPNGAIHFQTGTPNHEATSPPVQYNLINSVYGPNTEELAPNMSVATISLK
jgi:hypothetical protein